MAILNVIPSLMLLEDVIKVAIPSGMLCNIIATMETMPILYNFLLSTSLFI